MAREQNFKVYLTFRDDATGKFMKATEDQISSMKKLGLTVKKEGNAAAVDLDKMAESQNKAGRAGRYHKNTITELQGSIGSLRNVLLLYFFIMRPILNLYKQATEAAMEQENAETRLAAAFAATGRGSQSSIINIRNLASEMQNLTGYSDEQIIASSAVLATYKLTEAQIKKTIPVLLDMTAALKLGGDSSANLEAVAKKLGVAFTGQTGNLKRYGIVIDESISKYGTFEQKLDAIRSSVDGVSTAMGKTFSGQANIFKAAIDDLYESLGNVIIRSPVVIASMQLFSESIRQSTKEIERSREETDNFLESWKRISAAVIGVTETFKFLWRGLLEGIRAVLIVVFKIQEGLSTLAVKILEIYKKLTSLPIFSKEFKNNIQTVLDATVEWRDTMKGTADAIIADFSRTADALGNTVEGMVDKYAAVELGTITVIKAQRDGITNLKTIAEDTTDSLGNSLNAANIFMTSAVTGMRDSMVDGFFKVIKGEFEGLSDIVISFGDMMLKTILQIGVNMMMIRLGLGSFLGFAGGVGHTGGYMYAKNLAYGMPTRRYHSGGEVNATLLEGEGVLNRRAMGNLGVSNLDKLNRGESAGGNVTNNYYIQTIDERSFRERLQQNGDIYSGASGMDIKDNGSLRKTSQRYG